MNKINQSVGRPSMNILNLLVSVWGGCLLLLQVVLLSIEEHQFITGGLVLLVISVAIGICFVSSPWQKRRSGQVAIALTLLWWLSLIVFRRNDPDVLLWGIGWGMLAYCLPALLLVMYPDGFRQPDANWKALALVAGLVFLLLFSFAFALGIGHASIVIPRQW